MKSQKVTFHNKLLCEEHKLGGKKTVVKKHEDSE